VKIKALPATHDPAYPAYVKALKAQEWKLLRDLQKELPISKIDDMAKVI
jgi:hypothetical protein